MKGSMPKNMVKTIMKTRLNMIELSCNYKGESRSEICGLCKDEKDTSEHIFVCREIRNSIDNIPDIDVLKNDSEQAYFELGEFVKKVYDLRGIDMNKTVKENLASYWKKLEERKTYQITSFDEIGLKMVISLSSES